MALRGSLSWTGQVWHNGRIVHCRRYDLRVLIISLSSLAFLGLLLPSPRRQKKRRKKKKTSRLRRKIICGRSVTSFFRDIGLRHVYTKFCNSHFPFGVLILITDRHIECIFGYICYKSIWYCLSKIFNSCEWVVTNIPTFPRVLKAQEMAGDGRSPHTPSVSGSWMCCCCAAW